MKSVDEASVVVIGLGLIGSGALRHLAGEASDPVVGIGPGEPPVFARHEGAFASHYDAGRITRHLDPRLEWAVLAARSIAGYGDLEAASGRAFHRPVGAVMTERDAARVARTLTNAALMHVPVRVVAPGAPSPFAGLLAFPPDATLLCEPGPAGHIDPRAMLGANLRVAVNAGAAVIDDEVVSLVPLAGGVGAARWLVHTRTGPSLRADRVLIAAGPHADEFLDELGPRLEVSSLPQLRVRG